MSEASPTVAVIPGEDAAPEAIEPTVELLERMQLGLRFVWPEVGVEAKARHGTTFPEAARQVLDDADATLFGATSGPSSAALFHLRWGHGTYANVRPARWRPGFSSPLARPEDVDLVIVRENLEDLYLMCEGELSELAPLALQSRTQRRPVHEIEGGDGRYAVKAITRPGSERVIRFAFELARRRRAAGRPGRVTIGSKYNMLPRSDGLFREVGERVAAEYPDLEHDTPIVDDLAHRLVARPGSLDVVVLPNLYGDVLSDAAAALAGGLGVAPSGCYGDGHTYFESAHGTAPDIAGQGIINPTATLLSAAMMLDHLGLADAAVRLERAVDRVCAEGRTLTPDQGGSAGTRAFCAAVEAAL